MKSVIVIVAAYKRPKTLKRLLDSLSGTSRLEQVIVIDNGQDEATKQVVVNSTLPVRYIDPGRNLNCGGGVRRGLEEGLKSAKATHFWIFDDDAAAHPQALDRLLEAMEKSAADVAVPIILDEQGQIGWPPDLLDKRAKQFLRKTKNATPEDYLENCGPSPVPFSLAPWPNIIVTRRAIEEGGFPRDDFWLTGEDIEFTLRLTGKFKGVFVPTATCGHYPSGGSTSELAHQAHYLRICLMLQNISYIMTRLRHGRRVLKYLPANYYRFFRKFGFSKQTFSDAVRAFFWGGILGKTADTAGYQSFKARFLDLYKKNWSAFEQKI
jgi:GT2 family glycosyltransferase